MLGGGQRAIFLSAANKFGDELRDARGVFAKGACIDDGVRGIVVDVGVRRVNPLDAGGACFKSGDFAHGVGIERIAGGGEGHGGGEGRAFVKAHGRAALKIGADEQREF